MSPAGHEYIRTFRNEKAGLHAIVAVHSTVLGPAAGGCRLWIYSSEIEALGDALRLSQAMSYKNAMADLPFGGGKAVLIGPAGLDREALFEAFGSIVESMDGQYVTAEDVGTSVDDMRVVARRTRYVSGIAGGDPSPWTAMGVRAAMREALRLRLGRINLNGLTVAVQGVGNVGMRLCRLLHDDGVRLVTADINSATTDRVCRELGARVVPIHEIHSVECDVFAPCALGRTLNENVVASLNAPIVCGAANNQLASEVNGERLRMRDIFYVPDYVANAGGIINVAAEYFGWPETEVWDRISAIPARVKSLHDVSLREGLAMNLVADRIARSRIAEKKYAGVKALQLASR
jgi:leucine dehydrogenase